MGNQKPTLTDKNHVDLDALLGHVLDDYKAGIVTKTAVVGGLAQMIAALDTGNYGEVISWLEQGRKYIREEQPA